MDEDREIGEALRSARDQLYGGDEDSIQEAIHALSDAEVFEVIDALVDAAFAIERLHRDSRA